jgi:hypothetical protein
MKRLMPLIKVIVGAVVAGLTRAFIAEEFDSEE